jgi:Flp pilus assembly protein TadD
METKPLARTGNPLKGWLWKLVLLGGTLGLGTWLALSVMVPLRLPEGFPRPPDLQKQNAALRILLGGVDAAARSRPKSVAEVGRLGMVYHANQFYEQAESAYGIALRLAPDDYRWPYLQALLKEEAGLEKEVPALLLDAIRLKPDYFPALLKLAETYYKQDRLDEAGRYYSLASGREPSLQASFGLARIAARRKDYARVVEIVAPLSREYAYIRPPHQLLFEAYEALGRADLAEEERQHLLDPDLIVIPLVKDPLGEELLALACSSTRLLKEAGLLTRFRMPDEALRVARRAVEVEPGDADAHHFLARTLLDAHGADAAAVGEALAQLGEGLRLRPDDLLPLWYFANFFFKQEKTDAAVEQLRSMLAAHADKAESHYYLGLVADRQGRTADAVEHYREALRSDPRNAEALNKLGLAFAAEGKLGEAIAYFDKAVDLKPAFVIARSNLAVALDQQGRTAQAVAQFREALAVKPNDATTHMFLAIALTKLGNNGEAARHFREAIRFAPGNAEAHYGLGCALAAQRKLEEAAEAFREALKLRPGYADASQALEKLEPKIR